MRVEIRHSLPAPESYRAARVRAMFNADDAGFAIDEAEVVYWGRCPTCTPTSSQEAARQQRGTP